MKDELIADLCDAAADLIAAHPEAAAQVARAVGRCLRVERQRYDERRERDDEQMRRRGFTGGGGL